MSRSPGTVAATGSPAAQVQAMLVAHYAGDLAFTPESTQALRAYLSDELQLAITAYFAVNRPADEVPPINGDPYTDSQEAPTRFRVLDAVIDGNTARVPVEFADAFQTKRLEYRMQRIDGRWLLRDIDGGSGRFLEILGQRPGE